MDNIPSTKKEWELSEEAFERLLEWLGGDREAGGRKYEEIRRGLVKMFTCRGCMWAEELADEVINRVVRKIFALVETYEGDPALYFYGVAQNVCREYLSAKPRPFAPPVAPPEDLEAEEECLEHCMRTIGPEKSALALEYFSERRHAKIDLHQEMARRLGININALRIRVHRIRAALRTCVLDCLRQKNEGRNEMASRSI
ncbi:MAG: RNA polymerase sigma factor [Blastocatellia bacterium]